MTPETPRPYNHLIQTDNNDRIIENHHQQRMTTNKYQLTHGLHAKAGNNSKPAVSSNYKPHSSYTNPIPSSQCTILHI